MTWIVIAVGGAIGAVVRHAVNGVWAASRFPTGIAVVNITGCFIIGLLAGLLAAERIALRPQWREFVFVGLLGGYTTFSTFGLDTFVLARGESVSSALLNVGVQVLGGLLAVWLGYHFGAAGR